MNSADFSLSTYSMDDFSGDTSLDHFDVNLTHDSQYVIPLAKLAQARAGGDGHLKLFFSPWSPPAWMKESGSMINSSWPTGLVRDPIIHEAWAQYFVKYTKALAAKGLPPWGCTIQNEPLIQMTNPAHLYESCSYTPEDERDFLRDFLGPALTSAGLQDLVVMAFDWNKGQLANYTSVILADSKANEYLGGAAIHWYAWRSNLYLEQLASLESLKTWNATRHVLLATEACFINQGVAAIEGGTGNDGTGVLIGPGPPPGNGSVAVPYGVGELYLLDALGDISFGAQGWIDWNLVLDYTGGPNHINRSDISAPVLVDAHTNSAYVQSMYYYIGHLSRFALPGWYRVDISASTGIAVSSGDFNEVKLHVEQNLPNPPAPKPPVLNLVVAAAFSSPDSSKVSLVLLNVMSRNLSVRVSHAGLGSFNYTLPARSVVTFVYDT